MTGDLATELERVLLHTDKPKVGLVRPERDELSMYFLRIVVNPHR